MFRWCTYSFCFFHSRVFRAVNVQNYRIAACKVVLLKPETTKSERKALNKEIQVHHSLKHPNVLDFVGAVIVEPDQDLKYIPGVYMLLELAAGGDLFDKIGMWCISLYDSVHRMPLRLE